MNFKEKVDNLNKQISDIKKEFEQYISNKTISLEERWEVFMSAPDNLRGSSPWIERFEGLPRDAVGYDGPIYAERHQTVTVEHIMEVLDDIEEYDVDPDDFGVMAFKEDVLRRNIYSFTYDW